AAGLPAVHALAVTRRRSAELLRQSLLVAGLGLLPTGGQELQKLVKTARSLLIVIHPLLRCPSFPAAERGNGPRHGHLAGTDTGEPVSLRDRPGPGQEIYLRSAARPLLSLLRGGQDDPESLVLRAVSGDGTPAVGGFGLLAHLRPGLHPRWNGLDPLFLRDRARADRHCRDAERRLSRADDRVRAFLPARAAHIPAVRRPGPGAGRMH